MFCGEEYDEISKNAKTRWLCLEKYVEMQKFDDFKSYFLSEKISKATVKHLKKHHMIPWLKCNLILQSSTSGIQNIQQTFEALSAFDSLFVFGAIKIFVLIVQ